LTGSEIKVYDTVHITVIGNAASFHAISIRLLEQRLKPDCTVKKTKLRMEV
jgi:hypothetical protein